MTNKPTLITLDDVNNKLAGIGFDYETEKLTANQIIEPSPYFEAAAVMAYYDPAQIIPVTPVDQEKKSSMLNDLIGSSTIIADLTKTSGKISTDAKVQSTGTTYKILFALKDEVRKQTLVSLIKENRVTEALAANSAYTLQSTLPLQYLLTKCLKAETIHLNELSKNELVEFYKVIEWLDGITGVSFISKQHIIDKIDLKEMLSPFKRLTGVYENGVFEERFRGRHKELAILRAYVGVAPPQGVIESVERIVGNFWSSEKKPLLIFGLGGVGKSALLARFILDHIEAQKKDQFPFVYLDFDRPNLSAIEPESLLIEAARQLSIQYRVVPTISSKFSNFYNQWNQSYDTLIEEGSSGQISLNSEQKIQRKTKNKEALQSEFLSLISELTSSEKKPFLIVLDTFEEVQFKGIEFVYAVLKFIEDLRNNFPKMRIVLSGRSPVDKNQTTELELGNLDIEAAQGFISGLGIKDPVTAKTIAEKIGGNPLSLKLATDLVKQYGVEEIKRIKTTKTTNLFFSQSLPEIEVQGILYQRILEHIHNPEVKKLAHPGMVLRKITPALILEVLAGPCDLKNINTMEDAESLFQEISREVALVTKTEALVLKHRSDVRKVMLKLIMQSDKKELAMKIHQSAVNYYSKQTGIVDRAEEFYHRLALGQSPRTLEKNWIDGMENYLAGNRDELPEKAQAFIMAKAGIESVDLSIWDFADVEDQLRHLTKQAANLLNSGMAERALQLAKEIPNGQNHALTLIMVRALRQLGKFSEAADISLQALNSFYADEMQPAIKNDLQRYALEEERPGDNIQSEEEGISPRGVDEDYNDEGMTTLSV